jgi:hypothetical protein
MKPRVWRKIHIGIDEKLLEIRAAEFTTGDVGDPPTLPELLDQILPGQEIDSVTADGAFHTRKCHNSIATCGAVAIIPPAREPSPGSRTTPQHRTQRNPAHIKARWKYSLATMERV